MTAPEIMRAFNAWGVEHQIAGLRFNASGANPCPDAYPLYIGHPLNGQWHVRERMPGTRVWRAEEDGGFTLLPYERPPLFAGESR